MPELHHAAYGYLAAESYGELFCEALANDVEVSGNTNFSTLSDLRDVPAHLLQKKSAKFEFDKAVVDGWMLQEQIFETFKQGKQCDVPVLTGFTQDEGIHFLLSGYIAPPDSPCEYIDAVHKRYGLLTEDYLAIYPASDLPRAAYAPLGDGLFVWGTIALARLMASVSSPVYCYYFQHASMRVQHADIGAFHSSEVLFALNNPAQDMSFYPNYAKADIPAEDLAMAEILCGYWLAFARTGRPDAEGLPQWPDYSIGSPNFMTFQQGEAALGHNLYPELFELHQQVVDQRKAAQKNWTYKNLGLLAPEVSEINKQPNCPKGDIIQ